MDFSDKVVFVITTPIFCSLAERLARDFGTCYLYIPVSGSFVSMNQGLVGYGMKNVTRVDNIFGDHFEKVDLWVFPDGGHGDLQIYLEGIGKRVWGARHGEELEEYRGTCKEVMERLGLPVAPWVRLKGMDALRAHLKKHDNKHIKIDKYRDLTETWWHDNYENSLPKLDKLQNDLGGFATIAEFIVEDDLPDCVETGIDTYCIDGLYPKVCSFGVEIKDSAYVTRFVNYADIPEPVTRWTEVMAPVMAQYGYRGFLCNEIRIGEDHLPYCIDVTARAGSPPIELYQEMVTNLSDVLWEGADGVLIEPELAGKFGVQAVLKSAWAGGMNWQPVGVAPEWEHHLKGYDAVVDGQRYVLPLYKEMSEVGSIVGWGDTMEEAFEMIRAVGETVTGYGIKVNLDPLEEASEEMKKLETLGLKMGQATK